MKIRQEKARKVLEDLLKEKQRNGTIKNATEESLFLCGGMAVLHELTKHTNKDAERMECFPPKYFVAGIRGESINNFKYKEEIK